MSRADRKSLERAIALSRAAGHDKVPVSIALLRKLMQGAK